MNHRNHLIRRNLRPLKFDNDLLSNCLKYSVHHGETKCGQSDCSPNVWSFEPNSSVCILIDELAGLIMLKSLSYARDLCGISSVLARRSLS